MNINVRSNKGTAFVMGLSLMALTVCNQSELSFSSAKRGIRAENLVNGDSWKATLSPIGAGASSGVATMKVDGNNFVAEVETTGLSEGTHSQSVRSGTCPIEGTDTASIGESILSLDGDLSSEAAGMDEIPTSDVTGNYLYSESTDVASIPATIDLAGKIVVVYGSDSSTPVLCGLIEKEDAVEEGQDGQEGQPVPETDDQGQQGQHGQQDQDQGQQQQNPQQQQQQNQGQTEVYMPETDEDMSSDDSQDEPTAASTDGDEDIEAMLE